MFLSTLLRPAISQILLSPGTIRFAWGSRLLTDPTGRFSCASVGWHLRCPRGDVQFLVHREGAQVTFLRLQGEPRECRSLGGQSPAWLCPGGDLGQHVGLGVRKVIRSLVGTLSTSLWQEFTSVRGTDKLTAFREKRSGPRGSGAHRAGRRTPAQSRGGRSPCL